MRAHDLVGDEEPEPDARVVVSRARLPIESVEDGCLRGHRNGRTEVVHFDGHGVGCRLTQGHVDRSLCPVLDRVANQVRQHLCDPIRIEYRVGGSLDDQFDLDIGSQLQMKLILQIPQMDRHCVGKGGDRNASDGEQDLLRIERLRQEARGIGENRRGLFGVFLLGDVARDLGETT